MAFVLTNSDCFSRQKDWESWRRSHKEDISVENVEFDSCSLAEYDLSNLAFKNCRFISCNFNHANLISSMISQCEFINCDFSNAKLIAGSFIHSSFNRCNFRQANFLTAVFNHTAITYSDLTHLDLQPFDLIGIKLDYCDLRKQNLARKDLSKASLVGADLRGADLSQAIFNQADLTEARLSKAIFNKTQFKATNLSLVNLSSLNLSGVNFCKAKLTGCDLRHANLSGAKLTEADLSSCLLFELETSGWDIKDVVCNSAFWDRDGLVRTDYGGHEFERIYAEGLVLEIKYDYKLNVNEIAMLPIFIDHLQACHWGILLRLKSIQDAPGGTLLKLSVDDCASYNLEELSQSLQAEILRLQKAQLVFRNDRELQKQLKASIAGLKDRFWPRLLELAAESELEQVKNICILFIDLKDFTQWKEGELSARLSLFRGLLKPVLELWQASFPNMEGDSLRATFKNAKAAVSCADMLRDILMVAGFQLRVGIDYGQVTVVHNEVTDQADLEGTAVSMAARLESMARAGEILISEKLKFHAERETNNFLFIPQKSQLVKGIGDKKAGDWVNIYQLHKAQINIELAYS